MLGAYVSGRYEPKLLDSPQPLHWKAFKAVAPFQATTLTSTSAGLTLRQESTFTVSWVLVPQPICLCSHIKGNFRSCHLALWLFCNNSTWEQRLQVPGVNVGGAFHHDWSIFVEELLLLALSIVLHALKAAFGNSICTSYHYALVLRFHPQHAIIIIIVFITVICFHVHLGKLISWKDQSIAHCNEAMYYKVTPCVPCVTL